MITQAIADAMRQRMDPPAIHASSPVQDALRDEVQRAQKLKQIKTKYGMPDKPLQGPTIQWMGDNHG